MVHTSCTLLSYISIGVMRLPKHMFYVILNVSNQLQICLTSLKEQIVFSGPKLERLDTTVTQNGICGTSFVQQTVAALERQYTKLVNTSQ